jgi:hypothetical protein
LKDCLEVLVTNYLVEMSYYELATMLAHYMNLDNNQDMGTAHYTDDTTHGIYVKATVKQVEEALTKFQHPPVTLVVMDTPIVFRTGVFWTSWLKTKETKDATVKS